MNDPIIQGTLSSVVLTVVGLDLDPDNVSTKLNREGSDIWRKGEVNIQSGFEYKDSGWKLHLSSDSQESLNSNIQYMASLIESAGEPTEFDDQTSNIEFEIVFFEEPKIDVAISSKVLSVVFLWNISLTIYSFKA